MNLTSKICGITSCLTSQHLQCCVRFVIARATLPRWATLDFTGGRSCSGEIRAQGPVWPFASRGLGKSACAHGVKSVSEQGARLYIRPHTLREWRRDFAQYLRDLGVGGANATERAVRGASRTTKRDGIYRAVLRGESRDDDLRDGRQLRPPQLNRAFSPERARNAG